MALYEDLLILLAWLKANQPKTVSEVAAHFGYTELQVRQYIMLLSLTGPEDSPETLIDINFEGDAINVYETLTVDRPFRFDAMEAACLMAGIAALRQAPAEAAGLSAAALDSTEAKLKALLLNEVNLQLIPAADGSAAGVGALIAEALQTDRRLEFSYWNVARDEVEHRLVSPFRVRGVNQQAMLDGYCHSHGGWRSFQLSRMSEVQVSAIATELPSGGFAEMPVSRVVVSVPTELQHLLENLPVRSTRPRPDGRVEAVAEVAVPAWLARQVLASGGQLRVEAPAEFVKEVADFAVAAAQAYQSM